jgi:L-lysine exporter family protein LysE/ArgO
VNAEFLTGFLTGLSLIVAIGAQNTFVLQQALRREHRLPIMLICALSDAVLIVAGIAGLGALILSSPLMLGVTRYGGAAFLLIYAALAAGRALNGGQRHIEANGATSRLVAVATCLGLTFLNPHVYLDTVVLLGALANQQGESGRWPFGAGAVLASLIWFSALAFGASLLAPLFRKKNTWRVLDSLIAVIMLGLSISLLH